MFRQLVRSNKISRLQIKKSEMYSQRLLEHYCILMGALVSV